MQKLVLLFLFLFVHFLGQAQQLSVSTTYATLQGRSSEEIAPAVVLKNNSTHTMELRWERVRNNVPQGWDALVCDRQCASSDSRTFYLAPGESITDFRVSFRPNGVDGIGSAEIKIYEVRNSSNSVTVMFSGSAQQGSSTSVSGGSVPNIYPNPAVEYISIQDANDEVKYLEIYNVVGRKLMDFSVRNDDGKFNISDLPSGMYMVRMLDKNKNIIRTQRISKYNP